MSHSSKLMTIDAMMQYLAGLKLALTSGNMPASDYLDLFEVFADLDDIKKTMRNFDLVVTVDEAQQAVCNLSIERRKTDKVPSPGSIRATRVGFQESTWEMTIEDARILSKILSSESFTVTIPGDL